MDHHAMMSATGGSRAAAFRRARWRAKVEQFKARLAGRSPDLLCYDEVYELLKPRTSHSVGHQVIPLASVVGSVGRCSDYTRGFLPLKDSDQQRWMRIEAALAGSKPLPPIRVYQVGDVFFVADGNHRVSVARQLGMRYLEAHVVHIQTKARLSPEDRSAALLLKSEHARFLEATGLDEIRPQADLRLTVPGGCQVFETQIESHQRFLTLDQRRQVSLGEAVGDWYDEIYVPVVEVIRQRDLLVGFPGWTEADLYLALCEHRMAVEEALGVEVDLELAAANLARQSAARTQSLMARIGARLLAFLGRYTARRRTPDSVSAQSAD
jgi:hypothetical protein